MTPWPWHAFTVDGGMPPDLATVLIASQVGPREFLFPTLTKAFTGSVADGGFKIMRVIRYRNSFLPVVTGRIEPHDTGSRIHVRMRLHLFSAVFMAVWMGFAVVAVAGFVTAYASNPGNRDVGALLAPLGMAVFGWALTTFGFWFEANKQERMLREIFEAA